MKVSEMFTMITCFCMTLIHYVSGTIPPAALFVGMGYNLLRGNPDGDSHINAGKDPGLLMTRQILKLDPPDSPRELSYHEYSLCFPTQYKEVFYNTKSYQTRLLHDLIGIGNTTENITNHAFSLSEGFRFISSDTHQGSFFYIDEVRLCNKGRSRFMTSLAHSRKFDIGDEFAATVCSLPRTYDQQTYMNFLEDWGTHVVMEVEIGWENRTRKRIAVKDIVEALIKTNPDLLVPTGSSRKHKSSIALSKTFLDNSTSLESFASKMITISSMSKGSEQVSEPIKYKVISIDKLLDIDYWQLPKDIVHKQLCTSGFDSLLPEKQQNIQKALSLYAEFLNAPPAKDSSPEYPVFWPSPPFALPEPVGGCPKDSGSWRVGNLTHQLSTRIDSFPNNTFHYQNEIHLKGLHNATILNMFYCGLTSSGDSSNPWPRGSYCIAQVSNNCPSGFSSVTITYSLYPREQYLSTTYDQSLEFSGNIPKLEATSGQSYKMYYCCRSDGNVDKPIILPHQESFYLYPEHRTKKCQKVLGMRSTDEWIKYPYAENSRYNSCTCARSYYYNTCQPYDEDCNQYHKVHYCFYTRDTSISSVSVFG
ncbi:uncharacterized protein LOC133196067 [Saccostrea echinata]|uniref:uncharacterized protein LOC133196067 n=1 Tax=Saccostrea echinata TaxID=191078 RepID=UPI002A7F66D7|nr:uncharacterized protein LOC133196067 [Saccostrea echinata]